VKRREAIIALGAIGAMPLARPAVRRPRSAPMKKEVKTDKAPQAIGPYSQGIIAGGFLYCAGQIPLVPETGQLVGGSIEDQTRQVFKNISAILTAAGRTFDDVVKCTVFLQSMDDFAAMNKVYAEFFKPPYPARSAVQAARLPRDVKVEIEAIAAMD
jgi:2-iminobutanoate/2-iminopropanoate deaminase